MQKSLGVNRFLKSYTTAVLGRYEFQNTIKRYRVTSVALKTVCSLMGKQSVFIEHFIFANGTLAIGKSISKEIAKKEYHDYL